MKKWMFRYYSLFNYDNIEDFLSDMESHGYRLESRRFLYFFKFKKVAPRRVKYVLAFDPPGSTQMIDIEHHIKKEYSATQVTKANIGSPAIYRICDDNCDIADVRARRNTNLLRNCRNCSLALFMFSILGVILFFTNSSVIQKKFDWLILLAVFWGSMLLSVYYLVGCAFLRKKSLSYFSEKTGKDL